MGDWHNFYRCNPRQRGQRKEPRFFTRLKPSTVPSIARLMASVWGSHSIVTGFLKGHGIASLLSEPDVSRIELISAKKRSQSNLRRFNV